MLLEVDNLRKGFGSGRRRIEVLKGIDLQIEQGELVALMGPSGCGKSTLLNIIGGLLAGDSGSVQLNEFKYGTRNPAGNVKVRRHAVGWIFQDFCWVSPGVLLRFCFRGFPVFLSRVFPRFS